MQKAKQCGVEFEDKTRCKRLAMKTIEGQRICSKCYRRIKNQLLVEHVLGRTPEEANASMEKVLKEDELGFLDEKKVLKLRINPV